MNELDARKIFQRFWLADTAIRVGSRVWTLALSVVAIQMLAANDKQVGYLASAATISYLFIGLPAGVWIDRMSKRRVMIITALLRASLIFSVPVVWWLGRLRLEYLYLVALVVGAVSLFYSVAYQAYIPLIVGNEHSFTANARIEATSRAVNVCSPAIAGGLMKFISAPILAIADAIAYLASALILIRLPDKEELRTTARARNLWREVWEGVEFIWSTPALRLIAASILLSNFFATAISTLVPILVLESLHRGPSGLGLVYSAGEVGGLLGAFLLNRFGTSTPIGYRLAGGLIVAAVFTALVPLAATVSESNGLIGEAVLMISLFGTAIGGVTFAVSQISLRQTLCPKPLMGRVNATMRFIVWGTMPVASLIAGFGADQIGLVSTIWFGVIGTILTVLPILGVVNLSLALPNSKVPGG